jgi:anti-sigma factor RsiW
MDRIHRLHEAEITDALSGKAAEERIAGCESCAAEFAAWTELGDRLRRELEGWADRPAHFWTRQQERIRERLTPRATSLRWAAAAICTLVLLAFGMIRHRAAPKVGIVPTTPKRATIQMAQADPDDALLQDVHVSLHRELPAPLMPATVLVEELDSASRQSE